MKLNPRQIEKAMKRMGIQADQIEAEEVIIKTPEKDIVISSPQVTKMNMMGQAMTTKSAVNTIKQGPIPASTFEIPVGYTKMTMPTMPPGGAMPPGGGAPRR